MLAKRMFGLEIAIPPAPQWMAAFGCTSLLYRPNRTHVGNRAKSGRHVLSTVRTLAGGNDQGNAVNVCRDGCLSLHLHNAA